MSVFDFNVVKMEHIFGVLHFASDCSLTCAVYVLFSLFFSFFLALK